MPLIVDSGVADGLDILRGLALGANFVFMGRAFHYAVAALGEQGIEHLFHIISADLQANMSQIGVADFNGLAGRLC